MTVAEPNDASRQQGLGTFAGVFTPSVLTILGVIMYLRFGWVVGNVGLVGTLLIVTLSTAITFLTSLSISMIATDRVVRVGGAYYMISRSLGIETGGAVGIPLFFAQALSVSLYTIGFAESLALTFPALDERWVAAAAAVAMAAVALKSAATAIRTQYFIMAAIAVSLLSFFLGGPVESVRTPLWQAAASSPGFWAVFAVFFPAVTGIMAGVSMSGDLADPTRSIPRGTLAAVGVGYLVYMTVPIALAAWASSDSLIADPLIMTRMAWLGPAILAGIWGATLSSALGSILGAPRVLQALARDGILPRFLSFLGRGAGEADEPRIGTIVTLGIALVAIALGNLDVIAPVLTMFFLTTYLVLNLAAGIERFIDSPSFRPTFRAHWSLSLIGAAGCLVVMFLINALATVAAAVVIGGVFLWLERRELHAAWGDVRSGVWMSLLRAGLLRAPDDPDPKTWRPHLLVLSGAPSRRWPMIEMCSDLCHNRGLMTVAGVFETGSLSGERRRELEIAVRDVMDRRGVQSLVRLVTAEDPFEGSVQLVQSYGLGRVSPDTVVAGLRAQPPFDGYLRLLRGIQDAGRNLVLYSDGDGRGFGRRGRIDVWWGGLHQNGGLMLILAHLLRSGVRWRDAELRLNLMAESPEAAEYRREYLAQTIAGMRMDMQPNVIVAEGRRFDEVLAESVQDTDLVLLGMADPSADFAEYYERMRARAGTLPPSLHVHAGDQLPFSEVLITD